jgi:hypothetical protein
MTLITFAALADGWGTFHRNIPAKPVTFILAIVVLVLQLITMYGEGNVESYLVIQTTSVKIIALVVFFSGLIGTEIL